MKKLTLKLTPKEVEALLSAAGQTEDEFENYHQDSELYKGYIGGMTKLREAFHEYKEDPEKFKSLKGTVLFPQFPKERKSKDKPNLEKDYVKFTRSSIIVYPKAAERLNLKDGDIFMGSVLHDVNGSGTLYGNNKTTRLGIEEMK